MKQATMFTTEDLPLFSGTPMRITEKPFVQETVVFQPSLSKCRICHDTGMVGNLFCGSCESGHKLRRQASETL